MTIPRKRNSKTTTVTLSLRPKIGDRFNPKVIFNSEDGVFLLDALLKLPQEEMGADEKILYGFLLSQQPRCWPTTEWPYERLASAIGMDVDQLCSTLQNLETKEYIKCRYDCPNYGKRGIICDILYHPQFCTGEQ